MDEFIHREFGIIIRIKLKVIGIFISSILLYSCSDKPQAKSNVFLFKEHKKINKQKESKVFYELLGDTIYIRTSNSFWGENKISYKILSESEQIEINKVLKSLNFSNFKSKYTSVSHDIDYQYDLQILNSNKEAFKSIIYSDNFPSELRQIIYFFNEASKGNINNIRLKECSLSELNFDKLVRENDTINISSYANYCIWKKLNTSSNVLVDNVFNTKYKIVFEYPFNYDGTRITNIVSNNLKVFYYNLNGKTYSFKLEKPLQLNGNNGMI